MEDYQGTEKAMEEITIKFGKGLVGEPFQAKDGKEYVEIKIPNPDPRDKTPWASFVLPAKAVHDNQYGKGVWVKIPASGETRIRKRVYTGTDETGRAIWENQDRKIPNSELKEMVEAYKTRPRERETRSEGGFDAGSYPEEDPYHAADGSIPPWENGHMQPVFLPHDKKEVPQESVQEGSYHAGNGSTPLLENGHMQPVFLPADQKKVSHEGDWEGKAKKKTKASQER